MSKFRPGHCFYCRTAFVKRAAHTPPGVHRPKHFRGPLPARQETVDHVYSTTSALPPKLVAPRDPLIVGIISTEPREDQRNKVRCCHNCNHEKGRKHPLVWLTMCPSKDGARDLAALLLSLGENATQISRALTQRLEKPDHVT